MLPRSGSGLLTARALRKEQNFFCSAGYRSGWYRNQDGTGTMAANIKKIDGGRVVMMKPAESLNRELPKQFSRDSSRGWNARLALGNTLRSDWVGQCTLPIMWNGTTSKRGDLEALSVRRCFSPGHHRKQSSTYCRSGRGGGLCRSSEQLFCRDRIGGDPGTAAYPIRFWNCDNGHDAESSVSELRPQRIY